MLITISNTPIGCIGRLRYCSALGWREQVLFVWRAGQRISRYKERARVRKDMVTPKLRCLYR